MLLSPWSLKELQASSAQWQSLVGARLQRVSYDPRKILWLEFYQYQSLALFVDLRKPNFFIGWLANKKIPKKPHKDQPVSLFLRSHFVDRNLERVELASQFGRVLRFYFSREDMIEVRLYPKDLNVVAFAGEKSVAWQKPKDLELREDSFEPKQYREISLASAAWWTKQFNKTELSSSHSRPERAPPNELEEKKRQREIEGLQTAIAALCPERWRKLGDAYLQSLGEPLQLQAPELQAQLDLSQSWQELAQLCFAQAKEQDRRLQGMRHRLQELQQPSSDVTAKLKMVPVVSSGSQDLQQISGAKTYSKSIAADLRIHIGKSAKENLLLLRRAKPWFVWMHLRDVPGSHLILERNKGREILPKEIELAATELVRRSCRDPEEKFWVQYTECRFVRPIKGDRLGRVSLQQERTILVQSSK